MASPVVAVVDILPVSGSIVRVHASGTQSEVSVLLDWAGIYFHDDDSELVFLNGAEPRDFDYDEVTADPSYMAADAEPTHYVRVNGTEVEMATRKVLTD